MIVNRYKIKGPKLKAAVLADGHGEFKDELLELLQYERPDVIFIPGDLVTLFAEDEKNSKKKKKYLKMQERAICFLKEINNIAPVYYSIGNHEKRIDENYFAEVRKTGTILLDNQWIKYKDVWIGGQSFAREGIDEDDKPDISWLNNSFDGYKILMCHDPKYYELIKNSADLILAGHSHGGQWRFFNHGLYSPGQGLFPKYSKGQYGNMIVSAGLTNTTWLPRINNPEELVIIELN